MLERRKWICFHYFSICSSFPDIFVKIRKFLIQRIVGFEFLFLKLSLKLCVFEKIFFAMIPRLRKCLFSALFINSLILFIYRFRCLGTEVCISLHYVCDDHIGDCPNNSDESETLCLASKFSLIPVLPFWFFSIPQEKFPQNWNFHKKNLKFPQKFPRDFLHHFTIKT